MVLILKLPNPINNFLPLCIIAYMIPNLFFVVHLDNVIQFLQIFVLLSQSYQLRQQLRVVYDLYPLVRRKIVVSHLLVRWSRGYDLRLFCDRLGISLDDGSSNTHIFGFAVGLLQFDLLFELEMVQGFFVLLQLSQTLLEGLNIFLLSRKFIIISLDSSVNVQSKIFFQVLQSFDTQKLLIKQRLVLCYSLLFIGF